MAESLDLWHCQRFEKILDLGWAMAKMGRPTLLSKQLKEIAVEAAKEPGMTMAKLASRLKISRTSLWLYFKKDRDFSNAVSASMDMATELVEISLFRRATGYSHPDEKIFHHEGEIIRAKTIKHYPPSDAAAMFWLANRDPDRWKQKIEAEAPSESEVKIEIASDESDL